MRTLAAEDSGSCRILQQRGEQYLDASNFSLAYDTLRSFIEHCYFEKYAFGEFALITQSCAGMDQQGTKRWSAFRQWLKDVLHLNSDTSYFCSDLEEYAGTFCFLDENGAGNDYRTTIAILSYLADSLRCPYINNAIPGYWKHEVKHWKDTVTDSLKTPFDSTLPSLDQIGQTFLRGFNADVAAGPEGSKKALRSLQADRNPFGGNAEITYTTSLPCVAKMEVYDALGRQAWTEGQGYLDAGEHHLKISTTGWSPGTYYARLTTIKGEVLTTKLVFEKL
ncbi:MAG: T9SS type A sorting domain-containing protein [Bacteroidetes bacterium]|nr:T9SS type A sorting domain-containing protein [Bacteroidota bacterium]